MAFFRFILKDKYPSVELVKKYDAPLLITHGKKDTVIPYHHAQILFDNASSKDKQIKLFDNETHISLFYEEKNIPVILEFLKKF